MYPVNTVVNMGSVNANVPCAVLQTIRAERGVLQLDTNIMQDIYTLYNINKIKQAHRYTNAVHIHYMFLQIAKIRLLHFLQTETSFLSKSACRYRLTCIYS